VPVKFTSKDEEVSALNKQIDLLKQANDSYKKYLELAVNPADKEQVENIINDNNQKINTTQD
ncbi:MAG: hypothetical protein IJW73_02340, partial [Candidatus Gastranaerophilales bacterium]|nr:hypothetical protein [Candidatus Gastranaerophilales bacterium]